MSGSPARRMLPLVLLIVVLAIVGFWLQGLETGTEQEDALALSEAKTQSQTSAANAAESPPAKPEPFARTDAEVPDEELPPEAPILTVRVVEGPEERPVPGAEVLLGPLGGTGGVAEGERRSYQDANADVQLEGWGRSFACDAQGLARVPLDELDHFSVAARKGTLWARVDLALSRLGTERSITLKLEAALHLEVQVVDEQRQPVAGIPVAYWPMNRGRISSTRPVLTDAEGRARLRHLQEEFHRQEQWADQHAVGIALTLDPKVFQIFDPHAPPEAPIQLVLPPFGTVEVEVFTADGAPAPIHTAVLLQRLLPDAVAEVRPAEMNNQADRGPMWVRTQDGVARFERVGLGLTLESGVDFAHTRIYDRAVGTGPQRAGEVVRFTIRQSAVFPELCGRVVNEEGTPLARLNLSGDLTPVGSDRRASSLGIQTDEAGNFRVALGSGEASGEALWIFSQSETGRLAVAVVPLLLPLALGTHELGDVVLGGALLASGTVFDAAGVPTGDAYGLIELVQNAPALSRAPTSPFDDPQWRPSRDGRFEIRGAFPDALYRLKAVSRSEPRLQSMPIEIRPGAEGLEFHIAPPPGISGRVLLDPGISVEELAVVLENSSGAQGTNPTAPSGNFHLRVNEPTTGDLVIRLRHSGPELWRRAGIRADTTTHIEIGEVDLRGTLTATPITVLDSAGRAVSSAKFIYADSEARVNFPRVLDLPGNILSKGLSRGWMLVDGCALQEVVLNGSPQTIHLAEGQRLRLICPGLPPQHTWRIQLQQAEASSAIRFRFGQNVDLVPGSESVEVVLPVAGDWQVHLLWYTDPNESRGVPDAFGNASPLRVEPGSGLQVVTLPVDLAAVRAVIGD